MYVYYHPYPYRWNVQPPVYNYGGQYLYQPMYGVNPQSYFPLYPTESVRSDGMQDDHAKQDFGRQPYVVNIEQAAIQNRNFRTAIWTGEHLQVTLMSIPVGEDIGLEIHTDVDQFLRIEQGSGRIQMGDKRDQLIFEKNVHADNAIMVPAGKWHNITNTGQMPLKLYSIYAPPEHPFGTVHRTKSDATEAEENLSLYDHG